MLATSVLVNPCRARCSLRSVGRVTRTSSPTCSTVISRATRSESSPLGPRTVTRSGSIETVTPAGTGMGCLPIRDIQKLLPDPRHDLAPDALEASFVACHDSSGGRDDRRAHAALHARNVCVIHVRVPSRPGDALEPGDDGHAVPRVFEGEPDLTARAVRAGRDLLVGGDVALVREDASEFALEPRGRDAHVLALRMQSVTHAGEEVGDGVGHAHETLRLLTVTSSTWSCRG